MRKINTKKLELKRLDKGGEELLEAEKEVEKTKQALKDKEAEIDTKIAQKLTELRKKLKDKFKVDNTTVPNFGSGANRLTRQDHWKLQLLIDDIRFLVNNDEEKPTGIKNEDDAYTMSKDIMTKANGVWSQGAWESIGWVKEKGEENLKRSNAERIKVIKENKDNEYTYWNLNRWHSGLEELEKLVKLDDWELQIKKDLKEAIDKQDPVDNMKDWQNTLKKYEAGLEAIFDQAKIAKWKEKKDTKEAFNNLASIENLIKKVSIFEKAADGTTDQFKEVNPDFITFIKGKDTKLKTLTDLFKEKEPTDIIKYIHEWEFNKAEEGNKKYRYLRFAWSEKGGQQKIERKDKLEESEKDKFNEYLYECAIGKINESALTKPTGQKEDNNNPNQETPGQSWFRANNWQVWAVFLGLPLAIGIGLAVVYWDKLKAWWEPHEEDETNENE